MNDVEQLPLSAFMPNNSNSNGEHPFIAKAGKKKNSSKSTIELTQIVECLESIFDPELPVNIYDLGLIYEIKINEKNDIKIKMTLTNPNCPVAGTMPESVGKSVEKLSNLNSIEVSLVWHPKWHKDLMSEEAKLALDIF